MQETQVQSLGEADPLEKGVATHPVFLPGKFHGEMSLVGYKVHGVAKSWMQLSIHPFFIAILKTEPIAILRNSRLSLCLPQACPWRMRGQKEIHRWPPMKAPSIYCHVGALRASIAMWECSQRGTLRSPPTETPSISGHAGVLTVWKWASVSIFHLGLPASGSSVSDL